MSSTNPIPAVTWRTWLWMTVFAVSMALVESAVVIYIRAQYYPDGFDFPLAPMPASLAILEFWREAATIAMLAAVGILGGHTKAQRFAWFSFTFAVWDIFYYVWLKVFLDWPASFLTWDVLFLIPTPWVGPVVTPLGVTVVMIALAALMIHHDRLGRRAMLRGVDWGWFSLASAVVILSWTWDFGQAVISSHGWSHLWTLSTSGDLFGAAQSYVPSWFPWWLYAVGMALFGGALWNYHRLRSSEVGS